jgi:hypothetical protein
MLSFFCEKFRVLEDLNLSISLNTVSDSWCLNTTVGLAGQVVAVPALLIATFTK